MNSAKLVRLVMAESLVIAMLLEFGVNLVNCIGNYFCIVSFQLLASFP